MPEYCNMRAHIAAHDLYLASVDQSRKITAQEFAHNLQILLNCRYDSPLIFGCHDSQLKQHKTLSIRKNIGWFSSEILVKI